MGRHWLARIDWLLLAAAIGLVVLGVLAIDVATESTARPGPRERQLVWAGIALVVMLLAVRPSYRVAQRLAYVAFGLCVPMLVAVFWTEPVNGAQRWLRLGPIGVQPSELTKLAFVAALARYLATRPDCRRLRTVIVPVLLAALPMILILRQPDLGTAMLFVPVMLVMLCCAGARWSHLAAMIVAGAAALPLLWLNLSPAQRSRITSFLEQRDTGPKPHGDGYQLYQSKLMVALGGTTGSEQATELHVPFDHTDFIFSVIAGRWGLTGATVSLGLFAVLLGRGLQLAAAARDPFARLLAVGIVALFATQALVNLAMTVGLAPITGLTLPLVSYGGSSLVASFLAIGLLLNVRLRSGSGPVEPPAAGWGMMHVDAALPFGSRAR